MNMKATQCFAVWEKDEPERFVARDYEQPFWDWLKATAFHRLLCPTDNKWTRWFWERSWYKFHCRDPKTGKRFDIPAPLAAWLDCKCYDLRNRNTGRSSERPCTEAEFKRS
jgi:hypothetical protein